VSFKLIPLIGKDNGHFDFALMIPFYLSDYATFIAKALVRISGSPTQLIHLANSFRNNSRLKLTLGKITLAYSNIVTVFLCFYNCCLKITNI